FDEAIAKAKTIVELSPENMMGPLFLTSAYGAKKMRSEVVAGCQRMMELLSGAFVLQPLATCAANLGSVGETAEARKFLQRLEHPPAGIWIDPGPMGEAYAGVGDVKRSLDWYQQGVEERAPNMIYLRT